MKAVKREASKTERTNNVNLRTVSETSRSFERDGGHHKIEKVIEGEYRLEAGSPSFVADVRSEASTFALGSDEPSILGGHGVQVSPLTYVLYGITACFANTVAIQAALGGVALNDLRVEGRLHYDIGPMLTDTTSPLVTKLELRVRADRDIREIVKRSEERCPALFLVRQSIKTDVSQKGGRRSLTGHARRSR